MAKAKIHRLVWAVAALALVLSSSAIVWAQDQGASTTSGAPVRLGAPFRQGVTPAERKGMLEAWKEKRASVRRAITPLGLPPPPAFAVGRPSMMINSAGDVAYTRQLAGNSCDADMGIDAHWRPSQAYSTDDVVRPLFNPSSFVFRATNSGTTGSSEPVWPNTFGTTIVDGGVTWQATDRNWVANRTYAAGATVLPSGVDFGFTFHTNSGGTTGATEPHWSTNSNINTSDNTVTWQPTGFFPGTFTGCTPMQLVIQPSGGGAPTVIAQEGDTLDIGSIVQLSGWAEFLAMNSAGNVAFRGALTSFLTDEDEAGSAILTAGPGAGALDVAAASGDFAGGLQMCGFGPVVALNDAGQGLYDAYPYFEPPWQANHVYAAGNAVVPATTSNGLQFVATAGTSGSTEPAWPSNIKDTVVDGTITWTATRAAFCDESRHNIVRFSGAFGNELLFGLGTDVGSGVLVNGFGNDILGAPGTNCGGNCDYQDIDGYINSSGHASVAVHLSNGDTAAYLLKDPGSFTQVARTGGAGPGGVFGRIYSRTELNDSDQVLFRAQVGGVEKLIRWTPPSTYTVIASVGDTVAGQTFAALGFFGDINASGNVVFQADLVVDGSIPQGYYYWDGTVTPIFVEPTAGGLAQEMVMLNTANTVAYTVGAGDQEEVEGRAELDETGLFVWTKAGGSQKMIANGDVIPLIGTVSSVNAQHPSFRKRQMNDFGCVATQYYVGGITGGSTEDQAEGNGPSPRFEGIPPAGQLFTNCAAVCPTITVNPATLPGGTTGVPYSQTITQTGGAAPATFAITSGTQPTGLNLASNGKLTGTPTANGTFNFDVTATDKNGCTGMRSYSITIGCPTITLSPSSLPSSTVNLFYNQTITQSGGATPVTFAITSGTQPTGTNLSSSGVLSGTLTANGVFTFDVTATDKNGCTGVHTYTVTINPCTPLASPPTLSINPSSAHVGDQVKLTWTSVMTAGQGNYLVQRSVGGGSFSTIGTVPASNSPTMTFSFFASNPVGTQTFQVVASLACDPKGAMTSNTVTLDVSAAVTPPTCNAPPAPSGLTVSPNPVIPGQGFTLSWQAAAGADHYDVSISTDGGATVTSLGFVFGTSFNGTAPTTATGTIIFYVNSVAICGTAGTKTSVTVPVGQACIAPEPVTNITVQAFGVTPSRPPSPTDYILVSWTPSATGTKPTRYSVRINGDPEIFVIGTSVVLPPRGTSDPITAFVTPFGCAALTSAETFDPASSSWSTTGNLGLPRQEHTATLLSTGKVLVAGGVPNLFSPPSPTAELFDPALNQWTPTGTLAAPRAEHEASALGTSSGGTATGTRSIVQVGSQVLVEGGTGTSLLASSELYDATAGTWSGVGNLANARDLHTATVLQDGRVLVAGGLASGPLASAEIYDPATKVWTSTGSLATARYHHTATLLSSGKVLVAGGFGDAGALASAELFDPTAGTWTATGSLATARQAHSAALLSSGKVLVEGGDDGTNPIASSELYDPAAGTWSATGALIAARRNHTSTVLADGKVLVAGGFGTDLANALKSSELYDPSAGTFSAVGALKGAHGFHSATLLANGKVLVAGAADKLGVELSGTTADSGPIALFLSPPVASFTISANPTVGAPVTFTDTSSPQATSWLWIFDEGTANDPDPTKRLTSTLQSPTHVYANAGTHQVTLVASNGAGSSNATQSFNVAAASSVNRIVVSHTVQFDMTDPTRRRVAIALAGPNNTFLTLNTSESSETIVFLRFLDPGGKLVAERRLSVQPGSPAVYDLGAYGFTGRFSIELVSGKQFTSTLNIRGRSVREIHR
jgi:putative Ig domain-containing protein/PKD domain-containing protein/galactose oxidase-like protein